MGGCETSETMSPACRDVGRKHTDLPTMKPFRLTGPLGLLPPGRITEPSQGAGEVLA
ncbi:protein of unknown function (plasmid) [Streptantibioticus cattleyicolor NRRL 8057 = DSM 46488]|nr:protein of unknown function [Streptantibioticus cattleyicolor NRRL 8057 = DSM 46488]